ncbi:MAG: hypothetical protein NTX64_00850 [Elusimicrobia bacterium]|nr:hypothetical protein [Elusimicrobiota bacterium]
MAKHKKPGDREADKRPPRSELLAVALLAWGIVAGIYLARTPEFVRTHDFPAHRYYADIIMREHRLPAPYEHWETYQPPLYYLLNSVISPGDPAGHVFGVRLLSLIYGGLCLVIIDRLLRRFKFAPPVRLLVLLWIATTPKYVMMFTTYNNDALATLLALAAIHSWTRLVDGWNIRQAAILALAGTAAAYTKWNVLGVLAILAALTLVLAVRRTIAPRQAAVIGLLMLLPGALLMPWLVLHNQRLTGHLFPHNSQNFGTIGDFYRLPEPRRVLLAPPPLKSAAWKVPYVNPDDRAEPKNASYCAYSFVTSIFGEYRFPERLKLLAWLTLAVHLVFMLAALSRVAWKGFTMLSGMGLLAGWGLQAVFLILVPQITSMDFRLIAWTWPAWAILFAAALTSGDERRAVFLPGAALCSLGVFAHLWFLLSIPRV